jgi:lysophospholipase L1-like esterase
MGAALGLSLDLALHGVFGSAAPSPLRNALIAAWGDSLTAATGTTLANKNYPNAAADRLNVLMFPLVRGLGGQTSTQIAARQGGRQVLVSVTGDQIPASGAVTVPTKNINVLTNAGAFSGTIKGSIAGVPGTMSTDASGNWTFTRTASGSATPAPAGTHFILDEAVAFQGYNQWICSGTNNPDDPDTVIADIDAMIAYCGHTDYRIVSPLPSTLWSAPILASYETLMTRLRARYGARFVDARAALQAANDGSPNDLADIAAGYTPRSLRSDEVHLNGNGYEIMGFAVAASYPASDQVINPVLGLADPWGAFPDTSGWTVGAGWSIAGGRLLRDSSSGSEIIRTVAAITTGKTYRAFARGYRGSVNLRNGAQYISMPTTQLYVDFTATASTFGFQAGGALELMSVALFEQM